MNGRTRLIVATFALLIAIAIAGLYARYLLMAKPKLDERMLAALQSVQVLSSYEMVVETSTRLSDRLIDVSGLYRLDFTRSRFGSYATTTLTIPSEPLRNRVHTFTLKNVSIVDDIYVKIETESPFLKQTIPHSPEWRTFSKAAIPPQFQDIAVSGPVLDNLALFRESGRYLTLVESPQTFSADGTPVYRYRFELSPDSDVVEGGTLRSLMNRIGRTGTIDVWVDDAATILLMVVHGENYVSTTTISSINSPVNVAVPMPSAK